MIDKKKKYFLKGYVRGKLKYPTVTILLGPRHIYSLAERAMKSDGKMWINPFFYHYYCSSYPRWAKEVEASFKSALLLVMARTSSRVKSS